jgi:beta-N-acetylhexosaminidase
MSKLCTVCGSLVAALSLTTSCASRQSAASSFVVGPLAPTTSLSPREQHWVDSTLGTLSLHDRVAQMVMIWMLGDYTSVGDSTYAQVIGWVERDHIGGVSMSLGTPMEVATKLNDLQRRSRVPLLVSADLEPGLGRLDGGVFAHYMLDAGGATVFPPQMAIAATYRDSDAYDVGRAIAEEGRAVGIHVNFAPVVDVNNNPANPVINTRSFGEDPKRVARLAALFVRGTIAGGQLATAKHFPGYGDTDVDSHVGLPIVGANNARLDSVELVPFRAAIEAGAALVMTAHVALPAVTGDSSVPATLSPRIITQLLRDTLGFRGTAITDAMTMEGIGKGYTTEQSSVLAVKAGADILLKPSDPTRAIDAVVAAVERGEISRARIDSAARRVLELKARSGAAFQPIVSLEHAREVVGSPAHRALARSISARAITAARDSEVIPVIGARDSVLIVQYAPETELKAGRTFNAEFRAARKNVQVARIGPNAGSAELAEIAARAARVKFVVVTLYVRRVEGAGRFAIPRRIGDWIDSLAVAKKSGLQVVTFGNPYLIQQFPNVQRYLTAYGVSDDLERGAVPVVLGDLAPGHTPVSLPGFFARGDGDGLPVRR